MSETEFRRELRVRWADLDSNGHMANTAYLDVAVDVRMIFLEEHGFGQGRFAEEKIGPVVWRDELDYQRELRLLDPYSVTLDLVGMSEDGSRFSLRNEFFRKDGSLAARLVSLGGWLDLPERRLVVPPEELLAALRRMPRAEDFESLPSSLAR